MFVQWKYWQSIRFQINVFCFDNAYIVSVKYIETFNALSLCLHEIIAFGESLVTGIALSFTSCYVCYLTFTLSCTFYANWQQCFKWCPFICMYDTNHPKFKWYMWVTHMWFMWFMWQGWCCSQKKCMGILNSIYVHMHKQCLYMGVVFVHKRMLVCICCYCNYLMFYVSYNATINANAFAQFFPYKTQAALHHALEMKSRTK